MDNKKELIDYYYNQKLQGRYFSDIRKELFNKGLSEQEVAAIINEVDQQVLQHEMNKTKLKITQQMLYLSVVFLVLGLILFSLGYLKIFIVSRFMLISAMLVTIGLIMLIYSMFFSMRQRYTKKN